MNKKAIIFAVCTLVILAGVSIGILLGLAPSNARANEGPLSQEKMLKLTLQWGRLAPLPSSASGFRVSTDGGPFTRSFRASFTAAEDDLDDWIKASPGLQDAQVEADGNAIKYVITPGSGAGYAEAVIDFDKCFVETYVYWS